MLQKSDIFETWGVSTLAMTAADRASVCHHLESIMDFWCRAPDATLQQLHSDSTFCLLYVKGMHGAALAKGAFPKEEAQKPRDIYTLDGFFNYYKSSFGGARDAGALDEHLDQLRSCVESNPDAQTSHVRLSRMQRDALGYACNVTTTYVLANEVGSSGVADFMAWEFGRVWPRVQTVLACNTDEPRSRL